jgi:hypothetical protein
MLENALLQHILTPHVLCHPLLVTQVVALYVVMEASYKTPPFTKWQFESQL